MAPRPLDRRSGLVAERTSDVNRTFSIRDENGEVITATSNVYAEEPWTGLTHGDLRRLLEHVDELAGALERLLENAEYIFAQTPVRDWGETLAEARAALAAAPKKGTRCILKTSRRRPASTSRGTGAAACSAGRGRTMRRSRGA